MSRRRTVQHPRLIDIGGNSYFLGMQWSSFSNNPSRAEIWSEAEAKGANCYALREGANAVQVGFSSAQLDDIPKGTSSLAALLADSDRQPWLGLFQIGPDRWWYIAVRDHNAVLPDGDVVGTEEEARAARDAHSGFTDWNYLSGDLNDLSRMVERSAAKPALLKSAKTSSRDRLLLRAIVGATVALFAIGAGAYWYFTSQDADQKEQERRRRDAQVLRSKTMEAQAALTAQLRQVPRPGKLLEACRKVFQMVPVSDRGWIADQITCTPNAATIMWARGEGASVRETPPGVLSGEGERIVQTVPFQFETTQPEGLASFNAVQRSLLAWAQEGGFSYAVTPLALAAPPASMRAKVQPPAVSAVSFVIESQISPLFLQEDYEAYPGLRLIALKESPKGWKVEGVLYGIGR